MTWTDGVDRATGYLVTASNWNDLVGTTGSLMELKLHTHDGTNGDGASSLGPLVLGDFTDAAAAAAPGAGKTRLSSTSGRLQQRAGAAGATQVLAKHVMTAQGDIVYGGTSGDETRLGPGTDGHFLKTRGAGANPEWAAPSVAHADTTGKTADDHHNRTEAKETAGSLGEESVTWTTAFAATPVVTLAAERAASNIVVSALTSRSTTGAVGRTRTLADGDVSRVKCFIAQEAT